MRTFAIARVLCLGAGLCSTAQWATAQFGQPHDPKDDKPGPFKRTADGKPDLNGLWLADTLAPFDVEDHEAVYGIPAGKGVVVDPSDRKLPTSLGLWRKEPSYSMTLPTTLRHIVICPEYRARSTLRFPGR